MYKYYLLLFFSFLSISTVFSQLTTENQAIVYYKDGSVFIGKIVEDNATSIHIMVATGDTLHVAKKDIKRIFRSSRDVLIHRRGKMHYTSGIFVSTTMGGGLSDNASFDWDLVVGRHLNEKWSVGIGAATSTNSVWNFRGVNLDNNFIPIFAYGRYYLTNKRARLFAFSRLGYGVRSDWGWGDDHTGGVHIQPGVGIHFASRKALRFVITLSQMLQHTKGSRVDFDFLSNPINVNYNFFYNRTMLKIGIDIK